MGICGAHVIRPGTAPGRQGRRRNCTLKASIVFWETSGGNVRQNRKALLAEAMALTGDLDDALKLIEEIIGQIERPGWEERLH